MSDTKSVSEIVAAIEEMGPEERAELLARMARIDDLLEDLEDISDVIRTAREQDRPYEEFIAEPRAEDRQM